MLSRKQFDAEIGLLRSALEQRRKKYLRYYYAGIVCALALLTTAFFYPMHTLHAMQGLLGVHAPLKVSDVMAYRFFALLFSLGCVLGPVMGYRGERRFSVERVVFARVFGYFGDFVPMPRDGIRAAEVRKSRIFAEPLLFYPEEGFMGEVNGVRVRVCTCVFYRRETTQDILVFNGLLILCDSPGISNTADTNALQEIFVRLANAAKAFPQEKAHWDEKLVYASGALYARFREAIISRLAKDELPAEKVYRLKYAMNPLLARAGVPRKGEAFCEPYGFELSSQRCLVAVAGHDALFMLGSLFRPALSDRQASHLYEAMENIILLARYFSN